MRRVQSSLRKAEPVQHRANLRFDRVPVASPELAVEPVKAIGNRPYSSLRGIEIGHAMRQRLQFFFDRPQIRENSHAFGKDGAARKGQTILRKVSGRDALSRW